MRPKEIKDEFNSKSFNYSPAARGKAKGKKQDIAYQKKAGELEKMDVLHFGSTSFRNSSHKVSNNDLKHDLDVVVKEKPPWHGG